MRKAIPRLFLALIIAASAIWFAVNRDQLDASGLQVSIRELGLLAPVAHVGLFAVGTVLFVPRALFGLVGGALFGPVWGTLVNLLGATLGASAAFLLGRYAAGDRIRRMAGERLDRLVTGVDAEGWRFVAFVRLGLVCHTDKRSARAAAALSGAGFRNVWVLRGGMVGWHQAGLPVADQQ